MAQAVAAVDFGTSNISIVAGRTEMSGSLLVTGTGVVPYAGFRECEWLDWPGVKEALMLARKDAQMKGNPRVKDLYVSVPGEFIRTTFCRTEVTVRGKITAEHIAALVEDQEAYYQPQGYVSLHRTPIYYLVDGATRVKSPLGETCTVLEAWVSHVIADQAFIYSVDELLESVGLGVLGYVAGPVALGYHVRTHSGSPKTAVVIDAGHYSTDVMVAEGSGIVFHTNIPVGGVDLTNDIIRITDMNFEDAESLKRQSLSPGSGGRVLPQSVLEEVRYAMETRVVSLMNRILRALDDAGFVWEDTTQVYLTGGGLSSPRDLKDIITAMLSRNVKTFTPTANVLMPQSAGTALAVLDYAVSLSRARYGSGLQGLFRKLLGG
ncbi:MAG: cell division FtsA domain-containing protein [Eubacteriales bacterium]|nr:cell division FtsA domain-containing protein [Eubacteriales bacterium]